MKKIISIICAFFAVLSINSTAWAEEKRLDLWQFTIEEQCQKFLEREKYDELWYFASEFFQRREEMHAPESKAQADQWFAECVQYKRTYLDGLKTTLETALEGERPVFSPGFSSLDHKGLQLAVRELVLRYMAEPDAKLLFEKISKKWAPAVYFLFSLEEYPDFREPAMAASAAILEGGFAPPDVAAQRYGLRSEEPICKIDMRACATPQSWGWRVYDRPDLDAKVYRVALEYKKKLRDPAIPLYEKADAYVMLLNLLQGISKTTDTGTVKGDDFLEPLRFFSAFDLKSENFKLTYLIDRMDSPVPPGIDALHWFFALGWAGSDDYSKALAYLPDTAVARHFAACSIATAFLFPSGADYVLSQWGYNTWAFNPSFSLVKITPEVRGRAESWVSDTPADAEALRNELAQAQDSRETTRLIRRYATVFCQYSETYPWLAALYFQWKEKGINERSRAEILAVLNHTDAIPVAEYIAVLKDPRAGRILRYAAAGALYTLKVPAAEKDLLELYALYGKKPEDDILLANIVLAFRRTGDTPLRQELFAGIMQKPGYPFTKRQIRIIRHGKDIEEIFAETNKEETPERQAFFNAVDVPFRLDLYEATKDGKEDDRPEIMFMLRGGIWLLYKQKDNPDLEMAGRLFTALETEAANSKTPSTAFAARIMLSDVIDRRILEDFPHLERYRKFHADREIDKLRPGKIKKF